MSVALPMVGCEQAHGEHPDCFREYQADEEELDVLLTGDGHEDGERDEYEEGLNLPREWVNCHII